MPGCVGVLKGVGLTLGGLLVLGGVALKWALFPVILRDLVIKNVQLDPVNNAETWATWREPSKELPIFMEFTFLTVTNPDQIKAGEKPEVREVGPFVYKETRRKEGITRESDIIIYGSYLEYKLDLDLSCEECKSDPELTVINPALVGIAALIEPLKDILDVSILQVLLDYLVNPYLSGKKLAEGQNFTDDLFTRERADNLIFRGYEPGCLQFILWLINNNYHGLEWVLNDSGLLALLGIDFEEILADLPDDPLSELPDIIRDGKFAFFKGKNATADNSWYKVNSGMVDITKYQHILEFNGQTSLPDSWWVDFGSTPSAQRSGLKGICKDIVGTDGTQYPPFVSQDHDLWLFSSELCRSIYLSFQETVDMDGVETYQFSIDPWVLDFSNPDNFCYCPQIETCAKAVVDENGAEVWDTSSCTECRNGMISLSGCQGAPVFISLPHFLNADNDTRHSITGLNPDPAKHTTYINVEPYTGVSLDAHKRIQVNVPLKKSGIVGFQNVQEVVFPVVWVDESATITGESLDKLKSQLVSPIRGVDIGVGFMIGIGLILFIVVTVLHLCRRSK